MSNIKQNLLKFILSFISLLMLSACESKPGVRPSKAPASDQQAAKIAILLPLLGPDAALNQEYVQVIKMGLADGAKTKIQVTSYDVNDEPQLIESCQKLLEDKTDVIIGPIFSEPTKKVAELTAKAQIPIITLSNNPVLADKQTFVFGHAPMRQLEHMVSYLLANQYHDYVILFPKSNHYETVGKVLQNMIRTKGGNLAKLEFYNDLNDDLNRAMQAVSNDIDNINEIDNSLKKPVLLLADDPKVLVKVLLTAQKYNLDKKAVIAGDNRLDADHFSNIDIIYTGSNRIAADSLLSKVSQLGIKRFTFMHALAYDAGKMTSHYIGKHYHRSNFIDQLNSGTQFVGASGEIHFIDAIAQREYDILKRQNGEYTNLSGNNVPDTKAFEPTIHAP